MSDEVTVVIGAGGIGTACALALQGCGGALLLADAGTERAERVAATLRDGYAAVTATAVDIADRASVAGLAGLAASLGRVVRVVLAAGVSPAQADVRSIFAVDLVGTGLVIEAFGAVIAEGGAGVVVASLAGHIFAGQVTRAQGRELVALAPEALPGLDFITAVADRPTAYGVAKRGNHLQVRAAAAGWAARGARLNSVSPGLVDTDMGQAELAGSLGEAVRSLTASALIPRAARPAEIAAVVAFLLSDAAGYVTGTDVAVDGGVSVLLG